MYGLTSSILVWQVVCPRQNVASKVVFIMLLIC